MVSTHFSFLKFSLICLKKISASHEPELIISVSKKGDIRKEMLKCIEARTIRSGKRKTEAENGNGTICNNP